MHNEREYLLKVAAGDQSAFAAIVVHYRPYLLSYILTFTKSRERAEEIVQDVFLQLWLARESLNEIKDLRSYLFVISKNLALNAIRSILREKLRVGKWQKTNNEDWEVQPQEMKESGNILDEAVKQLPPQQQRVWLATRKEGKSHAEVAREMGISKETVKKYVQHANASITTFLRGKMDILALIAWLFKNNF